MSIPLNRSSRSSSSPVFSCSEFFSDNVSGLPKSQNFSWKNGVFVPIDQVSPTASKGPDELSFGAAAFVHSETSDLFHDLLNCYQPRDAYALIGMAMIRTMKPEVKNRRLATEYRRTFVSRFYQGACLSQNHVSTLLQKVGEDGEKRRAFYESRMQRIEADHHILIDGMLKQDTSTVNDHSAFSFKARVKGCKDISVLYAYDLNFPEEGALKSRI